MAQSHDQVSEYYGKVLQTKKDLKTSACCAADSVPDYIKKPLTLIDDEIKMKFYGCGAPIPYVLKDMKILDLGSGTGRDCYILSYLVGEKGSVVGIDMTDEQLDVANKHLPTQMEKFGYAQPNVSFKKGFIEDLAASDIPDNYFDLVISNCVVNLSPDKISVLKEVFRVLKSGGEFYFSDVYVDRRLPDWAKEDQVLLGECLGGALYWKDFQSLAKQVGFKDPRIIAHAPIALTDEYTENKIGFATFNSITYRLFKVSGLEGLCEDYGQCVVYEGGIEGSEDVYVLDEYTVFKKGEVKSVCSNTVEILTSTRLSPYFSIQGNKDQHEGEFSHCGVSTMFQKKAKSSCC